MKKIELNKIHNQDCIEGMKLMEENSVDAIITDPPYGLEFMGKEWDKFGAKTGDITERWGKDGKTIPSNRVTFHKGLKANNDFQKFCNSWAKECLRVLKPGGFLLSFGGTRTYHRMACGIEDAGFEIRDCIQWLYGCLSEDTEVLTINGWEHYHKNNTFIKDKEPILIYDNQKNIFKWERPERWQDYFLNKDTCYRIQSNNTDQIVSKNHRCLVEREGKLVFIQAEELTDMENMPTLSNNFLKLEKEKPKILLQKMQRILQRTRMEEVGKDRSIKSKKQEPFIWKGQSSMERWGNLFQKERELWEIQNKICSMSSTIYSYGKKGWLCNGASINNSKEIEKMFVKNRSDTSQRPQSREQSNKEFNIIQEQQGTQDTRGIRIEKAKVTKEEYSGLVFCPTVSTGCFVVRRNGKIFITGNSGFPKSLNIGKQIDKMQGNEREVVGISKSGSTAKACNLNEQQRESGTGNITGEYNNTKGNSEYEGWGTALKPANEPIVVARKPLSEKNVALNVLKWGTGGINIDACRIEHNEPLKEANRSGRDNASVMSDKTCGFDNTKNTLASASQQGRFPANIILDEEAGRMLDEQTGDIKSGYRKNPSTNKSTWFGAKDGSHIEGERGFNDKGGASRFFYCAKASKSERNYGCEGIEEKPIDIQQPHNSKNLEERYNMVSKNNHPTVKPIALMEYLIKLVSKPNSLVLDPFIGSGTTAIACLKQSRKFIGFEKEEEYCKIANARIKPFKSQMKLIGDE